MHMQAAAPCFRAVPADTTNALTVSPSLQAVRESQIILSTYMASKISKADLFTLPIPAERVTLRIANAAAVSSTFTTAIGFRLSDSSNVPATAGRPQPTPPSAGYPSAEFGTASTPISPTLALVARAETKLVITLCDAASTVDQNSITPNLTTSMTI
jgi:hypothetical protein